MKHLCSTEMAEAKFINDEPRTHNFKEMRHWGKDDSDEVLFSRKGSAVIAARAKGKLELSLHVQVPDKQAAGRIYSWIPSIVTLVSLSDKSRQQNIVSALSELAEKIVYLREQGWLFTYRQQTKKYPVGFEICEPTSGKVVLEIVPRSRTHSYRKVLSLHRYIMQFDKAILDHDYHSIVQELRLHAQTGGGDLLTKALESHSHLETNQLIALVGEAEQLLASDAAITTIEEAMRLCSKQLPAVPPV